MNKKITTTQIVGTGLLLALEIIFQIIGNYLQFGPVSINLSLVTIVMAAILYGPLSGAILGFFNGILVLFSPSTWAIFIPISPVGTVIVCLLKTTLAGFLAGLLFNILKKKLKVLGLVLASIIVPVVNTGIFIALSFVFFRPFLESGTEAYPNLGAFVIFGLIGWNFVFEIISTVVLSLPLGLVIFKRELETK